MTWKELLIEKGYSITSGCASCGGWSRFTNGVKIIRVKSKFAKLSVDGRQRLIKLTELGQYL